MQRLCFATRVVRTFHLIPCQPKSALRIRSRCGLPVIPFSRYCTMAEGPEQEVIGFTRRRVEAMMSNTGFEPEFPARNLMRLHLPGLSHTALDTQGQRQLVCYLMKLFDVTTLYWPLPAKHPDEMLIFYLLNYEMSLHPSLYDEGKTRWPLVIDSKINYLKRSSRSWEITIRQTDEPETVPMARSRFLEVNVDPDTRRPTPFPQWWKEERGFPEDGAKPEVDQIVKPESGFLSTERRIHFTDADENNHTNFVVYIRLCLDTFYENVLKRKYPNSSPVFLKGWIKSVKVIFKSDSVLGDILTVDSWEDGESPNTFHFEMRKGQEVAATVSLSFYSSLTDSRL